MRHPDDELSLLEESGLRRLLRLVDAVDPPWITIDGRRLLNFSSNDYLGLSRHPLLAEAAREAIGRYGTGSTASRLVCGSLAVHHELEEAIAAGKGTAGALAFSSGYACAMGVLTALLGRGDTVIVDKLAHASLVDGARQSGATVRVYPHNHLGKLERLLRSAGEKTCRGGRVMVVTESVFSMDGDRAALSEIVALKERFGALLLLDEAHGVGVLGPSGQGLAEELRLQDEVDLQMGTLGKAVGSAGGYVAADRPLIDLLVNKARSFIYSTAPPPSQAAAARAGIALIASPEGGRRRERLWGHLRTMARLVDLPVPASAIIPVVIGENEPALAVSQDLLEAGFLVPAMRYPTVSRGSARLRITLSAAHDEAHVHALAAAISNVRRSA